MKKYQSPIITIEIVSVKDVIAASGNSYKEDIFDPLAPEM